MKELKSINKFHCLLVNLGSPDSCAESDVGAFLKHFLMDKYVLRMPWIVRFILVNAIIVPKRKKHSLGLYQKIWKTGKSPIIENTELLIEKIEEKLLEKLCSVKVSYAMRYGSHSIKAKIKELSEKGIEQMLVIPMFPHYEKSTYLSAYEEVDKYAKKYGVKPIFVPPFFDQGDYISALERSVREKLDGILVDKLVFSYHGVPLSYLPCGHEKARKCVAEGGYDENRDACCKDCYRYQCFVTTSMLCENIGAKEGDYTIAFQSRLGHKEWLSPTLRSTMCELPNMGAKTVAVISPSFTADCLETLFEIDIEARELFMNNGGEEFYYIPALNDLNLWAKKLSKWIIESKKVYGTPISKKIKNN